MHVMGVPPHAVHVCIVSPGNEPLTARPDASTVLLRMLPCTGNWISCAHAAGQVATTGGAAVITMERGQASGIVQHANGTVWNVTKNYKSGFFSSWNKVGVA